jgi:hypothetical protein
MNDKEPEGFPPEAFIFITMIIIALGVYYLGR